MFIFSLLAFLNFCRIARIEKRSEMDFMNPDGNDVITRAEANFFFNFMDRNGENPKSIDRMCCQYIIENMIQ